MYNIHFITRETRKCDKVNGKLEHNTIYVCANYGGISIMKTNNREVDATNVKEKTMQLTEHGQDNPIILYWDRDYDVYFILDGQNRFTALKEMGAEFQFIIVDHIHDLTEAKQFVQNINNDMTPHDNDDVIIRNQDDENYRIVGEVRKEFKGIIKDNELLTYLSGSRAYSATHTHLFKNNKFKVTKDLNTVREKILNPIKELYTNIPVLATNRIFQRSYVYLKYSDTFDNRVFDEMVRRIQVGKNKIYRDFLSIFVESSHSHQNKVARAVMLYNNTLDDMKKFEKHNLKNAFSIPLTDGQKKALLEL